MENQVVYNDCYGGFSLSKQAIEYLRERGVSENELKFDGRLIARHNPLLIECVKTLRDKANGRVAKLRIETIEGDVYRIEEYDGREEVITPDNADDIWISIPKQEISKYIDKPIGSIFIYDGIKLEVKEITNIRFCTGCYFANQGISCYKHKYACTPANRKDKKQVVFSRVKE